MPDTARYTLPIDPSADPELVGARLWAAGALGVWEKSGQLIAWFPHRDVEVPEGGTWEDEADRDWQAEWKATIEPVPAGSFLIVPTWLADDHEPAEGERTIVLDPGRAFGSGHHATTTQCLELLEQVDRARGLRGATVIDVGTGTGILAIGAAMLGAGQVLAVDVDPDAVEVTAENATANGVELDARVGSADLVDDTYDVVLANLITDTIVALAGDLAARVKPGGVLIASGIADERRDRAIDALVAAGMHAPYDLRSRDGWTALAMRR